MVLARIAGQFGGDMPDQKTINNMQYLDLTLNIGKLLHLMNLDGPVLLVNLLLSSHVKPSNLGLAYSSSISKIE